MEQRLNMKRKIEDSKDVNYWLRSVLGQRFKEFDDSALNAVMDKLLEHGIDGNLFLALNNNMILEKIGLRLGAQAQVLHGIQMLKAKLTSGNSLTRLQIKILTPSPMEQVRVRILHDGPL